MDSFKIIGISVRTINKDGHAKNDIGNLWQQWFAENVSSKIPNKINDDIVNMYTEYESDEIGFYTTILGHRVNSLTSVPEGMIGKEIPASNYLELVSEGKLPECVLDTWERIWRMTLDRKYLADFDVYKPELMNPESAIVKTYVSIN